MTILESKLAHNPGVQSAQAGQPTVQYGTYDTAIVDTQDAANSIRMVRLPAQHRFVSVTLAMPDLDSGATGTFDFGLEDTVQDPADTTNLVLFESATSMQAASFTEYKSQALLAIPAVNYDRYLTINVDVVSATGIVAEIAVELQSRPDLPSLEGNF
jgi:hypothetical protein